jgi:hypothetical protein
MSIRESVDRAEMVGFENHLRRAYDEGTDFQWARELLVNALEAEATRVDFEIEWQAVDAGVAYRRTVIDNGTGMADDELSRFLRGYGAGGKSNGIVYITRPAGGDATWMAWVVHNGTEWGLKRWTMVDEAGEPTGDVESVLDVTPAEGVAYDLLGDGVDWSRILPEHYASGTAVVLLGSDEQPHTVKGDPGRPAETANVALARFLNHRMWEVPEGVTVHIRGLSYEDAPYWPRNRDEAYREISRGGEVKARKLTQTRTVKGAKSAIEAPITELATNASTSIGLEAHGTVTDLAGTKVHWYLWSDDELPQVHQYSVGSGFVALLYRGELYDITESKGYAGVGAYATFGIGGVKTRQRLFLIVEPPVAPESGPGVGVYIGTSRSHLHYMAPDGLKTDATTRLGAAYFATHLPSEVKARLDAEYRSVDSDPDSALTQRLRKLADRFGRGRRSGFCSSRPDLRQGPQGDRGEHPRVAARRGLGAR